MRTITALVFLFLSVSGVHAQFNPLQTQYLTNPFVINPACAGEQGFMSATCSYRRQWSGIEGAPETFLFTLDSPIRSLHHNIGLLAGQDNLAVEHKTIIRAAYAYCIKGARSFFAAGLAPGVVFNNYGWQNVITNSPDEAFSSNMRTIEYTIGYGVYFHSPHAFIGISGQAMYSDSKQLSIVHQPVEVYGGCRFGKRERTVWTVSGLLRVMNTSIYQCDFNCFAMIHDCIGAGISWRVKDAVAGMIQVKINDQFRVGYSYDYTISDLSRYSSGSHEIVLRYDFGYTVNNTSPR